MSGLVQVRRYEAGEALRVLVRRGIVWKGRRGGARHGAEW